jgi:sn-glycerol 3-phosphate transport system permease protein
MPVLYALLISFMKPDEILNRHIHLIPDSLYLGNYHQVITRTRLFRFILNSFIISITVSIARVLTSSLAAFSFTFFNYKGKKALFYFYLGSMLIPFDMLLLPNYLIISKLHIINTYLSMTIVFFVSSLHVFAMRQVFLSFPKEIKDAASIDSCSNFKFYLLILMPSSQAIIITVLVSSFISMWNTYIWPMLVTNRNEMRVAQVAITMLNLPDESPHGSIMAAAILILIPAIVIFSFLQSWLKSGIMISNPGKEHAIHGMIR